MRRRFAVVAGGMENMSCAPYLLDKARTGYRMGNGELIDSLIRDGLWDVYNNVHMGTCGDRCTARFEFTRQQQDDFAVASYKRALAAVASGVFAQEIVPVNAPAGKTTVAVSEDEQPGDSMRKSSGNCGPPSEKKGPSPPAMPPASTTARRRSSSSPRRRPGRWASSRWRGSWATPPRRASRNGSRSPRSALTKLMDKLHLKVADVDLFEINEAFAVVTMAAMKELNIPHDKVNVNGGAVALGHPIGASGARTLVTLLNAMRQRNARIGIDTLCIGGGEAVAMAVELL